MLLNYRSVSSITRQLRTGLVTSAACIGQPQRRFMLRRPDGRSDVTNHLVSTTQFQSHRRHLLAGEGNLAECLIDVTESIDPCHRLLAEVTTLGEADGLLIAIDLLRQVLLANVDAEPRIALLHANDLQ